MGAALGAAAIAAQAELWLPLLAAPFVVNAASVIVQMGAVRGLWRVVRPLRHSRTETARPFLCTPLHHHFQWLAWPDRRILALYWGFGAAMALWALLSLNSGLLWLVGVALIPAFLVAAAAQKLLRGSYFIGLVERPDQPAVVALYCGLPLQALGWRLYRPVAETTITESMLVGATAESILWRPVSEVEARIILGRIYADQRMLDEALAEWEQVPMRNLLLRPSVMLRMARIYYGRDRLLEAIKLWEQLPGERLAEMPNVREVVRSAKLRLAEVANKSHRQAVRLAAQRRRTPEEAPRVEAHLSAARKLNQELLSLLLYESGKLRGRAADPEAARARREMLRHTRDVVLARIHELDQALAALARTTPGLAAEAERQAPDAGQRAAAELGLSRADLLRVLRRAGQGEPEITQVAVHPKASRNTVYRLGVRWQGAGPSTVIAKLYAADRVDFFSACYRREEGVLRLLGKYGAAVPRVYAGELWEERQPAGRGLLLLQDLGDETLAERLEASEPAVRRQWLRSAVSALAALHSIGQAHLRELAAEISKVEKEVLRPEYYLNALRIAVTRLGELADRPMGEADWERLAEQARPLVDLLSERRQGFIHFEFTPHHLLLADTSAEAGRQTSPAPLPLAPGETRAAAQETTGLTSAESSALGPGLFAFDFEQATIGPLEFDLATLLVQPESNLVLRGEMSLLRRVAVGGAAGAGKAPLGVLRGAGALEWGPLIQQYHATASESGIPLAARDEFERGVAYAALLKCLGYAGAAANFLAKFGGEYHLQRLHHYLSTCQALMQRWPPLRPLAQLLAPRFRAVRAIATRAGVSARDPTGD
jgi:aminoglycoside/choline kinase family phosphotransferase